MIRLHRWQWFVLATPIAGVVLLLLVAGSTQMHHWGLDWLWAVVGLLLLGWRVLLSYWLRQTALKDGLGLTPLPADADSTTAAATAAAAVHTILETARLDPSPWEDWPQFWQRCQSVVTAVAQAYSPQLQRPLLQIYVPQAVRLLRDTIDDVDRWLQQLLPVLGQVTIGEAYRAYETYQKFQPAARWVWRVWQWSQWVLNPVAALARTATQGYSQRANQELLSNLGQIVREQTLRALALRAIALYSGQGMGGQGVKPPDVSLDQLPSAQTETLRQLLQAENPATLEQKPVNLLLVGRTGAGKSSLINTLFVAPQAAVDLLPSTDRLQNYHWHSPSGETLILWDSPGYEQIGGADLRTQVLEPARTADVLLLVTPATDPALEMDRSFLQTVRAAAPDLPMVGIVTQVDRLRPLREWQPPYDWRQGQRPKEDSIRAALAYRQERLGAECQLWLPLVTADPTQGRQDWGTVDLVEALLAVIDPAKQFRLARFLRGLETRTAAAAKIIDHYAFQMGTAQGLTALLKSPVLKFISTLVTGSPTLAILLAEKLPLEQSPVVMGKLQLAYELFALLAGEGEIVAEEPVFDLLTLWPLLLEDSQPVTTAAWALGHTLIEYWTTGLPIDKESPPAQPLLTRYREYFQAIYPPDLTRQP